jgi:hypothetical protein
MQLFNADDKKLFFKFALENIEKLPSKIAHNQPKFIFSVLPTGPKPALISISVPDAHSTNEVSTKGPSINYVVSKSAIFDPLPPLSRLFTK